MKQKRSMGRQRGARPESLDLLSGEETAGRSPLWRKGLQGVGDRWRKEGVPGPVKRNTEENELIRHSLDGIRIAEVAPVERAGGRRGGEHREFKAGL